MTLPQDLGPTLWPRVFAWVYFIRGHRENLPEVATMPELTFYRQFLQLSARFYGPPQTIALILSTTGFGILLGRAWTVLSQLADKKDPEFKARLNCLCVFISHLDFTNLANLAEIIDGAGTLDDLAEIVVTYIHDMIQERTWEINSHVGYIGAPLEFIHPTSANEFSLFPPLVEDLIDSLRLHKFVPALLRAMNSVHRSPSTHTPSALRLSFKVLECLLTTRSGYRWLPGALDAGLLQIMAALTHSGPSFDYHLQYRLGKLFRQNLVYYHVVAIEKKMKVVDICSEELGMLEIGDDWILFIDEAERRIKIMRQFDDLISTKACDNV
ncbi:hypothetical protein B0H19DRAFT_1377015 [Mycena capillaripes]|nr:hypothetical protein B0H19DRAFT_1377015 [Mycena capillaripes]